MSIVVNPEPGIVLSGTFDRQSPTANDEIRQFITQLGNLQAQLGFEAYIPLLTRDGSLIKISIIPASTQAPGASAPDQNARLGAALAGQLRDTFVDTGRQRPVEPPAPTPYDVAAQRDAGDMLATWFPEDKL